MSREGSDREFREIVDRVPAMIATADARGHHDYANKIALDFMGTTVEELNGLGFLSKIHPDEQEHVAAAWSLSVDTRQPMDIMHRLRRFDGEYVWFHVRVEPAFDEAGNVVRWYGVLNNVDDRKRAEDALRASERTLHQLVEAIPALVWQARPDGHLELVNRRLLDFTGTRVDDIVGSAWLKYVHPDDVARTVSAWRDSGALETYEVSYRLRRFDGVYRWFQALGEPLRNLHGEVVRWYGLLVDIDERRRTEEALQIAHMKLAQTSRILTVAELSASIAHEINQPLASLLVNAGACQSWLGAKPPDVAQALGSVERLIRDGRATEEVLERIRALFNGVTPTRSRTHLNEVVDEVLTLLNKELSSRGVATLGELERDLPATLADRTQIQQVLVNLIRNAIDAMDGLPSDQKLLTVRTRCDRRNLLLEIVDVGAGIQHPGRLFEPFFTTKENGMGIGLSICKSIVDSHDGRLWTTPNVPRGTVMLVSLPLQEASEASASPPRGRGG